MMITGSGGFHHSLTIIKVSTLHDKTYFLNGPLSIVAGGRPDRRTSGEFNTNRKLHRNCADRTRVHILSLEKS